MLVHKADRSRLIVRALVLALVAALLATVYPATSQPQAQAQTEGNGLVFTLTGGGWGHGVGMSQYGAWGRAASGQTATEILDFYYPGTTIEPITSYDDVRVHLATTPSTTLQTSEPITLVDAAGEPIVTTDVAGSQTLTVAVGNGTFVVTDSEGANLCMVIEEEPSTDEDVPLDGPSSDDERANIASRIDDDTTPEPEPVDACVGARIAVQYPDGSPVTLGATGVRYARGQLGFMATGTTMYVVAEELNMDTYLYGLAEVPASWPEATLDTQAIAGRSYAMERIERRRADPNWNNPWDMYSTVRDQAYLGYNHEVSAQANRWVAAVDRTSNLVMTWNNSPISAFYSSSNGGHTEDSGYVFFTSFPYFPAVPDTFDAYNNPNDTWQRTYTSAELSRWFAQSSFGSVGEINSIDIAGTLGASGRTDKATVTVFGSQRTIVTNGWQVMAIINGGVSREGGGLARMALSTKYTIEVSGEQPTGALDSAVRSGGQITVKGWFYDLNDSGSSPVEIHIDGQYVSTVQATEPRFDIATALQQGTNRGFVATVSVSAAPHQVCVHGSNTSDGQLMLLSCVTTD